MAMKNKRPQEDCKCEEWLFGQKDEGDAARKAGFKGNHQGVEQVYVKTERKMAKNLVVQKAPEKITVIYKVRQNFTEFVMSFK
jgi:hypothetical protein